MAINRIVAIDTFPTELVKGLNFIIADIEHDDLHDNDIHESQLLTAKCFQAALKEYGFEISLGQGRTVYSNYSFNNWATWYVGEPTTVEDAKLVLIDFANDDISK